MSTLATLGALTAVLTLLAAPAAANSPVLDAALNLHNHTYCSDGSDTPEALVKLAKDSGVGVLAITDHDNMSCIVRGKEAAAKAGIGFIAGIEISAANDAMHILGLNVDIDHPGLRSLMDGARQARLERSKAILANLAKLKAKDGRPIIIELKELLVSKLNNQNQADGKPTLSPAEVGSMTEEQLVAKVTAPMTRPDIAVMMVEKGFVPNTRVAFDEYLGEEGGAVAELGGPTFQESIKVIHEAGGIAVLAHPTTIIKGKTLPLHISGETYANLEILLAVMFEAGLDGVEQYKNNGKGMTRWIVDAARRHSDRVLLTPGSDYHGHSGVGQARFEAIPIPVAEAGKIRKALKLPTRPRLSPVFAAPARLNLERQIQDHAARFTPAR